MDAKTLAGFRSNVADVRLIMIQSAEEFINLRESDISEDQFRASNEEAPLEVWLEVMTKFPKMRSWVAHNKTVPIKILERLAVDESIDVRAVVASKRKIPKHLQLLLAKDSCDSVREQLAYNAKCDAQILEQLANDPVTFVRTAAAKRLEQ